MGFQTIRVGLQKAGFVFDGHKGVPNSDRANPDINGYRGKRTSQIPDNLIKWKIEKGGIFGLAMAGGITAEGIIFRLLVNVTYILDLNFPLLIDIVIITSISLLAV